MPKSFELWEIVEGCTSGTSGRSKTIPTIPVQFCVFRGNPESQRPGNQNRRSLIRNVGSLQSCCLMQDRKILLHLTRNLLCSVDPEFEPSSVVGFLFCCLDTLISFFETYSSRFFNFLAIPCMIFLEEPISQFQLSIQANFVPFSLICPSTCSMQLKSLRLKFLIEISKSNFRISRFPISRLNLSLSFIQFLLSYSLSLSLSLFGRPNFPFKDLLEIFFVFQRMDNVCLCLDLFSLF